MVRSSDAHLHQNCLWWLWSSDNGNPVQDLMNQLSGEGNLNITSSVCYLQLSRQSPLDSSRTCDVQWLEVWTVERKSSTCLLCPTNFSSHPEILGLCQGSWWTSPSPARGRQAPSASPAAHTTCLIYVRSSQHCYIPKARNAQRPQGTAGPRPPLPNLHLADSFCRHLNIRGLRTTCQIHPTPTIPYFGSSTSCFFGGKQKPIPSCHSQ